MMGRTAWFVVAYQGTHPNVSAWWNEQR